MKKGRHISLFTKTEVGQDGAVTNVVNVSGKVVIGDQVYDEDPRAAKEKKKKQPGQKKSRFLKSKNPEETGVRAGAPGKGQVLVNDKTSISPTAQVGSKSSSVDARGAKISGNSSVGVVTGEAPGSVVRARPPSRPKGSKFRPS
jgi:hypothetical protein